jgi:predicted nucleic acid-binding protein
VRLLLDINVVLDAIFDREPWADDAAEILAAAVQGRATVLVAGHTITTIHYLVAKVKGRAEAAAVLAHLLRIVRVVPPDQEDLQGALNLGLADYEDAVQAVCALKAGAEYIVSRDGKDFTGAAVPVATPRHIASRLVNAGG